MCGICGFAKFRGSLSDQDAAVIKKMNQKLFHRGPDAQDELLFDNIALGFSRLSIIGLENGMQPITNEDGNVVLICNGEIFNYVELREGLMKKGHHFKTKSDVEVIVHLYEEHGLDFLNLLNGQFAFALYDKVEKRLVCVRDQMGIIPLFYTLVDGTFIFGSEIKAILEHPQVVKEVDLVGLDQVFTFAGLISPRTLFKNINSLENGHFILVNAAGEISKVKYWDLDFPEETAADKAAYDEEYYIDRLEELLDNSIKLRLRADVPSGFYLSGGLDSSLIAMKIHQLSPGVKKEAFSIDFIDSALSESVYQRMVAKRCGAKLNQDVFFYSDISERLRRSVYHSECPIKETYNTASLSLSESVRRRGIKVILSGEGADELFAGYVGYRFDKMKAASPTKDFVSKEEELLRQRIWGDKDFFYERNYLDFDLVKKGIYSRNVSDCFEDINCLNHFVIDQSKIKNRDFVNKRAYVDFKIRLVDHLISDHGDRMAMANSVEVRYPFLDKDFVEFSAAVPSELKLKDYTEKYILKKMAQRVVPAEIIEREKFGFVAPGSPYLLQNNIEYINDILSPAKIRREGFFDADRIEQLKNIYSKDGFAINAPFESDLLITVISFGIFIDEFFNN